MATPGFQAPPLGITFDRFVRACVVIKTLTEAFQKVCRRSVFCPAFLSLSSAGESVREEDVLLVLLRDIAG